MSIDRQRILACNRTLNMRAIKAIGYDMDYTLVHYRTKAWERAAFEHIVSGLERQGVPTDGLAFDPDSVIRGLIVDTHLGNVVKANRFGFVKAAAHGSKPLPFDEMRAAYSQTQVHLEDDRWVFLNTLFSISEGCVYRQLVDKLDAGALDVRGYAALHRTVRRAADAAHMEGELKRQILADPDQYVLLDEETALTLLDQKHAGKKLLLITNSDWAYTRPMMELAIDPYLPGDMTWRELFDVSIVSARKPSFFRQKNSLYEVADDEGLLRPVDGFREGAVHAGGSAPQLEAHLGLSGDELLYVGDHMFGDVHVSKNHLRWRTALILRELEDEIAALASFAGEEASLVTRMAEKESLESAQCTARVQLMRLEHGYGPPVDTDAATLKERIGELKHQLVDLDTIIAPLARAAAQQGNPHWGLLLRAGNDKSHLARQVERYADVYTSRVSNFLDATPFVFLRSPRGSLPHDR